MNVASSEFLSSIADLASGDAIVLNNVTWEEFEGILLELEDLPGFRISYDGERLEVMSPSGKHERLKTLVHDLVVILSDELDQEVLGYGSVTLKLKRKRKGAEADESFYIQRAAEVGEKDNIDLTTDPPPDLAVEVDVSHRSLDKLAIYAALGVPEIWRFDGTRWRILELRDDQYEEADHSRAFSFLTPEHIAEFVSDSEARGRVKARRALRLRVATLRR